MYASHTPAACVCLRRWSSLQGEDSSSVCVPAFTLISLRKCVRTPAHSSVRFPAHSSSMCMPALTLVS